jgi:hypothetical protein
MGITVGWKRLLIVLGAFTSQCLQSQIPSKSQHINVWLQNGDMLLLHADSHAKGGPAIRYSGKQERPLPGLPKGEDHDKAVRRREAPLQAPGGDCYSLQYLSFPSNKGGNATSLRLDVFRFSTSQWAWEKEPYAVLEDRPLGTFRMLSDDYLLGVCANRPFLDEGKKPHLFSLYKRDHKGKYHLVGYPEDGFNGKALKGDGSWNFPILSNLWILNRTVWVENETVVGTGFGFFWIFSPKGEMRRLVRLYDELDDKRLGENWVWHEAVTNFEPRSDGRILISALSEGAVARGAILNDQRTYQSNDDNAISEFKKVFSSVLSVYPMIEWHVLDPKTGQISIEASPINFPSRLKNFSDFMNFNWQFKPDGNLTTVAEKDLLALSEDGTRYYEKVLPSKAK